MIHFSYFFMSFIVAPFSSARDGRKRLDPIETGEADETLGHSSPLANNLNFKGPTVAPSFSSDFVPQRKSALRREREKGRTLVLLFDPDSCFFRRKASGSIERAFRSIVPVAMHVAILTFSCSRRSALDVFANGENEIGSPSFYLFFHFENRTRVQALTSASPMPSRRFLF